MFWEALRLIVLALEFTGSFVYYGGKPRGADINDWWHEVELDIRRSVRLSIDSIPRHHPCSITRGVVDIESDVIVECYGS